ncbi:hypothetical protein VB780_26820 [Leptolyngbya sp. CCNP1308]|uniref:hypothetical protein n=1 Tax=Leptolyngbya sp. CCNP1308 TaxID=3110255 RepID=UPI002B20A0D5|nr:hypothetical protein [Leptolyngbya sp. CCNP1308]MEA5452216.1 hypothetical protein [Leptolyngbya sp. CCNP1308]
MLISPVLKAPARGTAAPNKKAPDPRVTSVRALDGFLPDVFFSPLTITATPHQTSGPA